MTHAQIAMGFHPNIVHMSTAEMTGLEAKAALCGVSSGWVKLALGETQGRVDAPPDFNDLMAVAMAPCLS